MLERFTAMRLTRFTDYSLRVLIYLGQNSQNRVTINQISETYDISKNHLMKVVSNLTRLDFVSAQRGPGGGIQLNRAPAEICLKEVIRNTEKHLHKVNGVNPSAKQGDSADTRLRDYLHHAIVTSVRSEILVMDEWMAVGDADFVVRAEQQLRNLVDNASILVLASHSDQVLEQHCNLIVTLEHGEIVGMDRVAA